MDEKPELKYIETKLPDGFTQRKYIVKDRIIYVEFNGMEIRVREELIEKEKPKLVR